MLLGRWIAEEGELIDTDVFDLCEWRLLVPGIHRVPMEASAHIMVALDLQFWRLWGSAPRPLILWLWSLSWVMDLMAVNTMASASCHGCRAIKTNVG